MQKKTLKASLCGRLRIGYAVPATAGIMVVLLLAGCTAKHYRKAADKETYQIIQQVEQQIFGKTNSFTIDTRYSNRKPAEIMAPELVTERLGTNARVVTIEDALDLAVKESRRYQAAKENLYLAALSLTGERYEFGPKFFAGTTGIASREPEGDSSVRIANRAGMNQLLRTGGSVGVSLANTIVHYFFGNPRKSVVTLASAQIAQPLLRGFGWNSPAVEALTQAERNVVYAVRDFAFFQDQFALEIVSDYFELLASKDIIRNRYTNYLSRVDSTKRLEERAHDREALNDVDQARQAELTARNTYVNAVANYQNALDQFKIKLGLPVGEKVTLDDTALRDVEERGLVPVNLPQNTAYRLAVERQLPVLNAIDEFEDLKRKVRVAKNQFLPDLDLNAGAELTSSEPVGRRRFRPTDYTRFNADQVRTEVSLGLDLPIDRLRERNTYRRTLVQFESGLRDLTLTLDTLKDDIERGLRTLEQRRQNYEIQKNALVLANRRVESTTLLLQAGRAEVRDLVEAQDAQIDAQNAVLTALVSYQEARLQLMLDIGAVETESSKFWLKDHLVDFFEEPVPPAKASETDVLPPDAHFVY